MTESFNAKAAEIVARFIADRCHRDHFAKTSAKELSKAFAEWCEVNKPDYWSDKALGCGLVANGVKKVTLQGRAHYRGISVAPIASPA